ncbi:MAG: Sugar transporter permease [Chloroflexi bacterium]|jgi:putative aldouronate transport system permease protein|nr:Sugar transporter permease [Chloroflexota bacterium]
MQQPLVEKVQQQQHQVSITRSARFRRMWAKNGSLFLMALPGLLLLFVFSYLPMFGIIIAFKDYRAAQGLFDSAWVGLKNFEFLFGTQDAWRVTFNTLFLNSLFIVTSTTGAIFLALMLNEVRERSKIMTNFYQSALLLPHFISYVIVGYFVFAFLNTDNGLVNHTLAGFGVEQISWYSSPQYWPTILTSVNLWKHVGFNSIIYLSGILAINPEYFEAAKIDGASKWKQITRITIPLIFPLVIITTLLAIGRIFYADFGLFYQVTRDNGLLYPTTDVLDTYVYRALRVNGDVGMSAAAGLYQALIGFILVVGANWIVRRVDSDKALF